VRLSRVGGDKTESVMAAARMQRASAGRISMSSKPSARQSGDSFLEVGTMQENMLNRQKAESLVGWCRLTVSKLVLKAPMVSGPSA
jgi:hypothetical protein